MCACRLEEMQQTTALYADLEEYLYEMEKNRLGDGETGDVYAQLAQKENDLILAAELGKALLERNEELSRANELITEEYSRKLEVLEQEKHALRRKLDTVEGDYDGRVSDLLGDLSSLRGELHEHQSLVKSSERERSHLVQELTEQNHRLTEQLKQATKAEDELQRQVRSLREQFHVRRSNLSDHALQLEGLRQEIELLTERKADLEKRMDSLSGERESLNLSLEESSDRIVMLEKHNKDQEQKLQTQRRDLEQLRDANDSLQDQLGSILRRSPALHTSLYNEIEMMEDGRSRSQPGSSIGFHDEEDIECDDLPDDDDNWKLRQELTEIYHQLWRLCEDFRRRRDNQSADSGVPASPNEMQNMRAGMLSAILKELKEVMHELLVSGGEAPCLGCQSVTEDREEVDKLRKVLEGKSEELRRKQDQLSELTTKLTIQERELVALREECDQVRLDLSGSKMAKEEIVKKAWEVRDQAVARKNNVEIELARTRIDVMHINSQLMEAIQQKIELSQQLEQWQVDMQSLLDDQVQKKLRTQEQEEKRRAKILQQKRDQRTSSSKSKLFGLWR